MANYTQTNGTHKNRVDRAYSKAANMPLLVAMPTAEQQDLARLEKVIEKGLMTFVQVGEALDEICSRRLYRATHKTFEAYCKERWGFTKQHAYRLISAAAVAAELPGVQFDNEHQVRQMAEEEDDEALSPTAAKLLERVRQMTEEDKVEVARKKAVERQAAERAALKWSEESNRRRQQQERIEKIADACDRLLKALAQEDGWDDEQVAVRKIRAKAAKRLDSLTDEEPMRRAA